MTVNCFVDTNLLVYFRDASEPLKQKRAEGWLAMLWRARTGRISFQILSEYYVTVTRRLDPGLDVNAARADIRSLFAWRPIDVDRPVIEAAWAIQDRYGFSWWDSLVVAAAQRTDCAYLLTEDMQHGQEMDGVTVINPFEKTYEELFAKGG